MCLEKTLSRACDASILVKKDVWWTIPEAYCPKPLFSVFAWSPWKIFLSLEIRTDIRHVSGVVYYLGGLQICELSAIILVQLRSVITKQMVLTGVDIQEIVYDNRTVTIS